MRTNAEQPLSRCAMGLLEAIRRGDSEPTLTRWQRGYIARWKQRGPREWMAQRIHPIDCADADHASCVAILNQWAADELAAVKNVA